VVGPLIADRGGGLQILKVAVNFLNKQSQTVDKRWSSSLGVWQGANKSHLKKKQFVTKCHTGPQI
jgi:hypothetical protein